MDSQNKPAISIDAYATRFETGNMRMKQQNELRQEYNKAIDTINNLPPTAARKIAKHALAKEYRKNIQKIRD